jgi:hypothetical protein
VWGVGGQGPALILFFVVVVAGLDPATPLRGAVPALSGWPGQARP